MTRTNLTRDTWAEVFTGVTEMSFSLVNYPDTSANLTYKIHYGLSMPADDTDDFMPIVPKYDEVRNIIFSNTTSQNIYIMPINDNGAVIY